MATAIVNARIFDGRTVLDTQTIVIDGVQISAVGGEPPAGAEIIDAAGATLLPGLIDAHVHTNEQSLHSPCASRVTTELEMQALI